MKKIIVIERVDRNDNGDIISTSAISCWDYYPENIEKAKHLCYINNNTKKMRWRVCVYNEDSIVYPC